jgi:hypothetical protein
MSHLITNMLYMKKERIERQTEKKVNVNKKEVKEKKTHRGKRGGGKIGEYKIPQILRNYF